MISAGRVLLIPKGEYDSSETYTMLDMVSYQGSSYIAKGTTTGNLPTNTTYWQLSAYGGAASVAGNFATLETTAYASQPYSIGERLVDKDGKFCNVTDTILQGDEIVLDTNVEETTVDAELDKLNTLLSSLDVENLKLFGGTAIITQTDLNSLTTPGQYYKSSTSFYVTNGPTAISSELTAVFRLNVEKIYGSTDDELLQTLITPSGTIYTRGYDGSTWTSWNELSTAAALSALDTSLSGDISAAETRLSAAFTGATALADGAKGMVPQPLIADVDKFLKADGTWTAIAQTLAALSDVNLTSLADGDMLRYNATSQKFENVPYKYLTTTLAAGATSVTFTDAAITATAKCAILTNPELNHTGVTQSTNTVVITFPAQASPVTVGLEIRG